MTRLATLSGAFLLGICALFVPAALAVDLPPVGEEEQEPAQPPEMPQEVNEAAEDVRNGLGGNQQGGAVPRPPSSDKGIDDIPDGVTNILLDDLAVTGAVTLSIAGLAYAGFWLASRYVDPKVALQSPERSMLYGFVKGNPGVHLKQLSNEFSMKTSTVLWHVRKLEAADLIRSKKANGYRVFYPVSGGMEASQVSEAVTALSNVNARTIFAFLAEHPDAPLRDVTDRLGINGGTVRWHLKKLRKAGLLDDTSDKWGLKVTELGVKAWNQVQGGPAAQVPIVPDGLEIELEAIAQAEESTVRSQ